MLGLMMDMPLTVTSIMGHVERVHGGTGIVSVTHDQPRHRCTYADAFRRARQLASALAAFGIRNGDRVGTLAWNDYRHFELYYAISCMGAVTHTINPRLFPEQIAWIVNDARDRVLFVDPLVLPIVESVRPQLQHVETIVVLSDAAHMPAVAHAGALCYEGFIAAQPEAFSWPDLEEQTACTLCYTSGTTGNPRGVLYSHRSQVLHSLFSCAVDALALSARDVVMPVVPMFHVNAWGLAYSAPLVGAKLVFPGPKAGDGETLQNLMDTEQVTFSAGVPTVWLALLAYLRRTGKRIDSLQRVVIGGAACPWSVMEEFERDHGVHVHHAWGMTEMSPLGTVNHPIRGTETLAPDEQKARRMKQGRAMFGVEMKVVDDSGAELPWDGRSAGLLKVRGPTVCAGYFQETGPVEAHAEPGWFATGDVAHIDADGYLQITDRAKDVIKSGGEWISSIDLENAAMEHPAVAEAAVIAVPHPTWTERPLLILVLRERCALTREEMLAFLRERVAKWWLPDDVVFVTQIPHTATGKILKTKLRKLYTDYKLHDDEEGKVSGCPPGQ
ncbi:MAG: long-chain-fatty-acid--CoA ligase [Gammaproteobacteria bacterium]|nr:long-chain-fatty-acid--CoA ligase [Gammaproteobacteria bacterium]